MADKIFLVKNGLGVGNNTATTVSINSTALIFSQNSVKVGIGNSSPLVSLHITAADAVFLPAGNTGQRPSGANGMIRYNSETSKFEGYAGSAWGSIGGGGSYFKGNQGTIGDAADVNNLYRINANTQTANVSILSGENVVVAGPLTVSADRSLTVETGGRVVVV